MRSRKAFTRCSVSASDASARAACSLSLAERRASSSRRSDAIPAFPCEFLQFACAPVKFRPERAEPFVEDLPVGILLLGHALQASQIALRTGQGVLECGCFTQRFSPQRLHPFPGRL